MQYKREIGPIPAPKRGRLQKAKVETAPCLCEECRRDNPIRQALWEAQQRATKGVDHGQNG